MERIHRTGAFRGYNPVDQKATERHRRNFSRPTSTKLAGATALRREIIHQAQNYAVTAQAPKDTEPTEQVSVTGIPYGGQEDGHVFDVNATHVPNRFWTEGQV